jgi:hypothetical protein
MFHKRTGFWLSLTLGCGLPILVLAQAAQQSRTLLVTGRPGELAVVDMGGHAYVDVESLARFVDGTLSYSGNRIVLSMPSVVTDAAPSSPVTTAPVPAPTPRASASVKSQPAPSGFSKDFLRAGIEQMSVIREWHSTLVSAVQRGFPITDEWMQTFSSQAQSNLRLVSVAVSTDSDRNAFQLLTNEFNNMKRLSDRYVHANQTRSYLGPDSLDNDSLNQKIISCGHSLAGMAANNQFVDDGSCQ